jgi:hypothetical protein
MCYYHAASREDKCGRRTCGRRGGDERRRSGAPCRLHGGDLLRLWKAEGCNLAMVHRAVVYYMAFESGLPYWDTVILLLMIEEKHRGFSAYSCGDGGTD